MLAIANYTLFIVMKCRIEDATYKGTENREDGFGRQIAPANVKEDIVVLHTGFPDRQILWNKPMCRPKRLRLEDLEKGPERSASSFGDIQNEGSRTMMEARAVEVTWPDGHHWTGIHLCTVMLKDEIP